MPISEQGFTGADITVVAVMEHRHDAAWHLPAPGRAGKDAVKH
jgi:hypothetical protein